MGQSSALAIVGSNVACQKIADYRMYSDLGFKPLKPTNQDDVVLAEGLKSRVLIKWLDPINSQGDIFGFNNDFTAFLPIKPGREDDGVLWVNHEYADAVFVSKTSLDQPRTREAVDLEMQSMGGSLIRIKRDPQFGDWFFQKNDPLNFRITSKTLIPMDRPILGTKTAVGTVANCSGGLSPWNTILSCEENYDVFYGEREGQKIRPSIFGWEKFYPNPPEHYGWVIEIEPFSRRCIKRTALGRFAHEGAAVVSLSDGRVVVYMGDDEPDQCIYKFIGDKPGSLESGVLYAAQLEKGRWLPLDLKLSPQLKSRFKTQIDVWIHAREAAHLLGASPCNRPEDIEVNPLTKDIIVALTYNKAKNDIYGALLKIEEKNADPAALEFTSSKYIMGGPDSGFACPDNLAFDRKGHLWMTSDLSSPAFKSGNFGNNGLFYIPTTGNFAGRAFQIASAPVGAEFTGPWFSNDYKTLFISVQHPGEGSPSFDKPTSHWPEGGQATPKPSVICIQGPLLERLAA